ncbi:MAG: hypothetical protein ACPG7F_01200 [Aggregatilineales bacterium]
MSPAFEKIMELSKELKPEERSKIMTLWQNEAAEAARDGQLIKDAPGDALEEDGSIDFDLLYSRGGSSARYLHSKYPELIDEAGHINPPV